MDTNDFGVKDMLLLLNGKVDDVLAGMGGKADQSEVLKLRDRMHKVEGQQAANAWLIDHVKDLRVDVQSLDGRLEHVEKNQMTKEAVETALRGQREDIRKLVAWVVGILGSLGVLNLIVNWVQGAPTP